MHPQIRQENPGKCPICAMDLIPLKSTAGAASVDDPDAIPWSDEAAALANVRIATVERAVPSRELRMYGSIRPDERRLQSQTSHVSGRIEALSVRFAGETVEAGQVIAVIYSPDLLNAQQELLEALKWADAQPALLEAAREKLRLWKITDSRIAEIERTGKASPTVEITANAGGVVMTKRVEQGDYVERGSVLFDLADLSSVWAVFEAYEADLPYLGIGTRVEYALPSLPGETFAGSISFIDPAFDQSSRTLKVRVETSNPRLRLKPGMYARGVAKSPLRQPADALVIPRSAVLWTGKRSIVYVKLPHESMPVFKLREVELGASAGETFTVLSGLAEGEEIAVNGAFMIDASAQLEGKPSMMNREESEPAELIVEGLCEMCKERIELASRSIRGVVAALWNASTRKLELKLSPGSVSLDAVAQAIAAAGHDNSLGKAPDSVYSALPECCLYRGM
jgi:Cu(I)/Ag(I) efflux system membrane fusion protein